MTINFVCRQSKAGKDGLSPLELYVIIECGIVARVCF